MSSIILIGDACEQLMTLDSNSVDCIVTSPPYWGMRDYGVNGQIGLEPTIYDFLDRLGAVFAECYRVLKQTGTMWVNMGDSYSYSGGRGNNVYLQAAHAGSATKPYRRNGSGICLSPKSLIGQPWRVAFMLQDAGWILRQEIIWHKPNPMPECVKDRPTRAHEQLFLFTKSEKYYYDGDSIRTPIKESRTAKIPSAWATSVHYQGQCPDVPIRVPESYKGSVPGRKDGPGQERRSKNERSGHRLKENLNSNWDAAEEEGRVLGANARSVWVIPTCGYSEAHFATFPPELPRRCISAGCAPGGVVLDPFAGSGTTLAVAVELGRNAIGIELNPEYAEMIRDRLKGVTPSLPFHTS